MRRVARPFLILLALLFLMEAWLWEHVEPWVARLFALVAWERLKIWLRKISARISPPAALVVFVVPLVVVLVPLKFAEVYFLAHGQWLLALVAIVIAKVAGVGVTAFVFDATRDKLLQMPWFARLYDWFVRTLAWAHALVDPLKEKMRRYLTLLRGEHGGRFLRRLIRLRRRAQRA